MTEPFPQPPPRAPKPRPRRSVAMLALAASIVVALIAVIVAAAVVVLHPKSPPPTAAEHGMLQVETAKAGDDKLDPAKPLRCFVNGQFVGQATLADCAAKNGVSAQNLDVGLDPSGQIAAQAGAPEPLAPLPEADATPDAQVAGTDVSRRTPQVVQDDDAQGQGGAQCLRYTNGGWRQASAGSPSLRACVHELYEDRCVQPGQALYGRFGQQTLRLVPGRVEISDDNRRFRYYLGQDSDGCSLDD